MIKTSFLVLILLSLPALASRNPPLRPGDILLQPLKCWACSLIEAEEETIYSHVGVVLSSNPLVVAEAFSSVRMLSLQEFGAKTEAGQRILVMRFRNERLSTAFMQNSARLVNLFEAHFQGRKYDHDFRWNNFDEQGEEKYYCSEMISKLFQAFIGLETPIKRMHFQKNRDAWMTYFKGNIPDNQWGNSPGDFLRSELFYPVGEL